MKGRWEFVVLYQVKKVVWAYTYHWKFSEGAEWPPIQFVVKAKIWTDDMYEMLRNKLRSPVPEPVVVSSPDSTYITIDSAKRKVDAGAASTSSSAGDRYVSFLS